MIFTSASFLRMCGGSMLASIGSHYSGVDLTVPLITPITLLSLLLSISIGIPACSGKHLYQIDPRPDLLTEAVLWATMHK
jgi:hypothetical protein